MALVYVDDTTFEKEVEGYSGPKLVAFFAVWCPHCHRMMPVFEDVAKLYEGQVKVFAVDVDKAPKSSAKYGVHGIPTMLFFSNAKDYTQLAGEQPLDVLKERLNAVK